MKLGQHFLKDQKVIDLVGTTVVPRSIVIEVGAGRGGLTGKLAEKAEKVIAFEIDLKFRPFLERLSKINKKIKVFYEDFLKADLKKRVFRKAGEHPVQIVANLPFHILEPFLHKTSQLPIKDVVVMIGKKAGSSFLADEQSPGFGQVSLLAQTFFTTEVLTEVGKESFDSQPKTSAVVVRLAPRKPAEYLANQRLFILKRLFATASSSPLLKNALKEGLVEYSRQKGETLTQKQAKMIVENLNLSGGILNKPFQQLNNAELKFLSKALL